MAEWFCMIAALLSSNCKMYQPCDANTIKNYIIAHTQDRTVKNIVPVVNGWPCICSTGIKRVYINPSSNDCDINQTMIYQEYVRKSTSDQ